MLIKNLLLCFLVFLCFQQAKAFGTPSDSLQKNRKWTSYLGLGWKTGGSYGRFEPVDVGYGTSYRTNYKNICQLGFEAIFLEQKRFFFSSEFTFNTYYNKVEVISQSSKFAIIQKKIYRGVNFRINFLPGINVNILSKEKLKIQLGLKLAYKATLIGDRLMTSEFMNKEIYQSIFPLLLSMRFKYKFGHKNIGITFNYYASDFIINNEGIHDNCTDFFGKIKFNNTDPQENNIRIFKAVGLSLSYQLK